MTYIHPDHRQLQILNLVIAGLIFTSLVGVFSLVALYNNIVNLNHNIAAAKSELDTVGANNTALNHQVTAAMGNLISDNLAMADGLVQDNHPQYFQLSTNQQPVSRNQSTEWPIASQR
jgi:hypothetical protein